MDKLILYPDVPYTGPIGGGGKFTPEKLIRIHAEVSKLSKGFNIKLQCGPNIFPQDDIPLQISVKTLSSNICLNSFVHGKWNVEICVPIGIYGSFEILVICEFDKYKVSINNEHFCDYPHTVHYDRISHLSISGDVSLAQISYEPAYVDSYQIVKPPPSYEITINDNENLNPYPVQSMISAYAAVYDAQQIQHNITEDEVSTYPTPIESKRRCTLKELYVLLGVVIGIVIVILKIISKRAVQDILNEHYYHT